MERAQQFDEFAPDLARAEQRNCRAEVAAPTEGAAAVSWPAVVGNVAEIPLVGEQDLRERPDLFALLDVTHPEPPAADSPLWTLPNVRLSSHIAGSIGDEVVRMADFVLDEFEAWQAGRLLRYAVTPQLLETMA